MRGRSPRTIGRGSGTVAAREPPPPVSRERKQRPQPAGSMATTVAAVQLRPRCERIQTVHGNSPRTAAHPGMLRANFFQSEWQANTARFGATQVSFRRLLSETVRHGRPERRRTYSIVACGIATPAGVVRLTLLRSRRAMRAASCRTMAAAAVCRSCSFGRSVASPSPQRINRQVATPARAVGELRSVVTERRTRVRPTAPIFTRFSWHPIFLAPDFLGTRFSWHSIFLAGVEGLEPPTPGFGDRCSSH
jgi:hypothetical protein